VAPAARMCVLDVPPVSGAALIGLDELAAERRRGGVDGAPVGSSIAARVRSAITHETMRGGAMAAAATGAPDGWEG
jgi:hypothetical protein